MTTKEDRISSDGCFGQGRTVRRSFFPLLRTYHRLEPLVWRESPSVAHVMDKSIISYVSSTNLLGRFILLYWMDGGAHSIKYLKHLGFRIEAEIVAHSGIVVVCFPHTPPANLAFVMLALFSRHTTLLPQLSG